jgi:phosphoenolpyruvate carboxykinase (ATP)
MATKQQFALNEIRKANPSFSKFRTLVESAFYQNNVVKKSNLQEMYNLASKAKGVTVTDMGIFNAEMLGLDKDSKVLVYNSGSIVGRSAEARRIMGTYGVDDFYYSNLLSDAIYDGCDKTFYHGECCIGSSQDFMAKAHLMIPENYAHQFYSWHLNFRHFTEDLVKEYYDSTEIKDEADIYIYVDPDWKHEDFPFGAAIIDPEHNCAAILGMKYFGELKKGTLTLYWAMATRHDFVACHGGQKRFLLEDDSVYTLSVFGLSGSGKSTITHYNHDNTFKDITILHDDSFVINLNDGSSLAIEKTYFDKTQDYPTDSDDNKYLLMAINNGITLDQDGRKVIVTEDIRNGNGRAIKSEFWSPNTISKIEEPVNAIVWLMKDPMLPPVIKVTKPDLASLFGATLATKRTTAENLRKNSDLQEIVIEPYANPFRTYPLVKDYQGFKRLFEDHDVDCYVINTGHFLHKKIPPKVTLDIISDIVNKKCCFQKWGNFDQLEIMEIEDFIPDMEDTDYLRKLRDSINSRIDYIENANAARGRLNRLPLETIISLEKVLEKI